MALGAQGYIGLCYGLSVPLVVAFGVYAVAYGRWFQSHRMAIKDTEAFTTARGTQSLWRIGWSFFCGAVGAWALVTPANFASFAGIVGVVSYAITTGIPILLIAFAGERITSGMPHVYSLADFVGWRFGAIAKTVVALIALFNMCIVLLAEYTTIGSIFADYVGTSSWGIIVAVAVVTTCYTAYGGLAVSIATDQLQGIAAAIAAIVMVGYVGATYRHPIPKNLPENLGPNEPGWTSLFTLTASLIASTFFSEAMWQRVWASASPRTLRGGAVIGFSLSTILVFLSGFGGWLALVGGLTDENTNPNLYLFELLGGGQARSWIGVVAVLLAVCMNIGAVDSLQNGIASSLGGHFFKHAPLWWNRVGVVALNVPLAVLAITRGYNVLSLFLVTNLLCCCAAIPIALGLLRGKHNRFFTETGVIVGILTGVLGLTALGIGLKWDPVNKGASFASGADWAWFSNGYDWRAFLAALLLSTGGDVIWCCFSWVARKHLGIHGPGVTGVLMKIPGMGAITASPGWMREEQPKGWDSLRELDAAQKPGNGAADDSAANGGKGGKAAAAAAVVKDVEATR